MVARKSDTRQPRTSMRTALLLVLLLLVASLVSAQPGYGRDGEDYYHLLNVNPRASNSEIKKAWRKLSMKYHPDKNPGDEQAAETYKKINRAYEILSNDELRQVYDQAGEDGLERYER